MKHVTFKNTCVDLPQEKQKGPVRLENWGAGSFEEHHRCKVNKVKLKAGSSSTSAVRSSVDT